jgi:hypothetical protein
MKDNNLVWEIGTVTSSELKSLTILLQDKKGEKKEYPVLLKAVLSAADKVVAEATPVTVLASEKSAVQTQETPTSQNAPLPKKKPIAPMPGALKTPAPESTPADNPPGNGPTDAKPTPAGGN